MPSYDALFNALVTMLVTIDPPGLAPLFLAVTAGMNRAERKQVAVRSSIIAFFTLALFAVAGASIPPPPPPSSPPPPPPPPPPPSPPPPWRCFGITLPAFRVAGGLLLFYIAFEMIFERRQERHEKSAERGDHDGHDPQRGRLFRWRSRSSPVQAPYQQRCFCRAPCPGRPAMSCWWVSSRCASARRSSSSCCRERVDRFLGETGRSILTRLLGVILAALAVQFVADGIKALMAA